MRQETQRELTMILGFIGLIWLVFLTDTVLPVDLAAHGLMPRTWSGAVGIVTMPFLHAGWKHITSNTVPLCVLLCLLAGSRSKSAEVVGGLILLGGSLLWLFGRGHSVHVGASGLICGLAAFLIVAGVRERRFIPLAVAVVTGFLYGGTLLFGILPTAGSGVSWDGHLTGAIAGALLAVWTVSRPN